MGAKPTKSMGKCNGCGYEDRINESGRCADCQKRFKCMERYNAKRRAEHEHPRSGHLHSA